MSDHSWGDFDGDESDSDLGAFDYLDSGDNASDAPDDWSDLDALSGYETASATTEHHPGEQTDEDADDGLGYHGHQYGHDTDTQESAEADFYSPALGADDEASEDHAPGPIVFDVTNPAGTVTAHATLTGRIQRVELAPDAVSMTESDLVRDIMTTAKLANMKGRAVQRSLMQGLLMQQGLDRHDASNYLDETGDLPTPRAAQQAQAEVLAEYLRGDH